MSLPSPTPPTCGVFPYLFIPYNRTGGKDSLASLLRAKSYKEAPGSFESWAVQGTLTSIEYSLEVLEYIRIQADEGYYRLARGGLEIGGLLFGTREGPKVRVVACQQVECEYALGPSFRLSERDLERFQEALSAAAAAPELEGLEAVGWYHSHTRSEIFLSEEDVRISDRFFPEPGQIALVVRPNHFAATRAGFFFREADGSIGASASLREFVLTPAVQPRVRRQDSEEARPNSPAAAPQPPPAEAPPVAPDQEPRVRYLPARAAQPSLPAVATPVAGRSRARRWILVSLALVALAAAGLAGAGHWISELSRQGMALSVRDADGQLRIEWDRNAAPVVVGSDATIEISDGTDKFAVQLDAARLRQGHVSYTRRTGSVDIHMRVRRSGQFVAEEFAHYAGPAPATVAGAAAAGPGASAEPPRDGAREQLEKQLETMKAELAQQSEEIRRLKAQPEAAIVPAQRTAPAQTVVVPPHPPSAEPAQPGTQTGRLIWTGGLKKGDSIAIYGANVSSGRLIGELPGVPVRIRVSPASISGNALTVYDSSPGEARPGGSEAPGPQNGNLRTVHTFDRKNAGGITVLEKPGTQNSWRALSLRSESRDVPAIVVLWEAIPN